MATAALSGSTQNMLKISQNTPQTSETKELLAFLDLADKASDADELLTLTDKAFGNKNTDSTQKGVLTAESLLTSKCEMPAGTQTVAVLNLSAADIEQFRGLQVFHLSELFQRLAWFVPRLQEECGRKLTYFDNNAADFGGYYGIVDPLMLAGLIPYATSLDDLSDPQITECMHAFQLIDNFPTIQGRPVWERQEWERVDYYNLFKIYRDMRYAFYNEADALYISRSLSGLARAVQLAERTVNYLAHVYNWSLRAAFYDTWMAETQRQRQVIKQRLMLDRHTKIAQSLTAKAFAALKQNANKLSAKEAIQLLELGLKYERISAGLPGDKPEQLAAPVSSGPVLSIVNQTNNTTGPMQVNNAGKNSEAGQRLQEDMKKPDTLLSILSVLQRSGALDSALDSAAKEPIDVDSEVIEDGSDQSGISE
jgi:hypothetical protein